MAQNNLSQRVRSGFGRFGGKLAVLLVGLGLLAIGIGYNGASGYTQLPAQFPYLLSGGLLGVSLVGLGCALMVVNAHREDRARLEAKLDAVIAAVEKGGTGTAGGAAPADVAGLVVAGSASYHVPGCRLVDGREEVSYLTPEEARARFLAACRVCQPDAQTSNVTVA